MPQTTLDGFGPSLVDQSLIDRAKRLRQGQVRPIPTAERYPAWWGQLRAWNQSPKSLGELDYGRFSSRCGYARDDREDPDYEQHFVTIHDHTATDTERDSL